MRNKMVMIAGATGFLGQALCRFLPDGFDLYTPTHDDLLDQAVPNADYIIHAAGYATPSLFVKNAIDTIRVNTETTICLLEHLNPGGSFLYCSSAHVYRGCPHWASENDIGTTTPYYSRAPYIEGKRCGETIVNAYRNRGVRAMSARIETTYGPGTHPHDGRVVNQIIEQALTKGKIELIDDGSAILSLCYLDDMAKMLWTLLLHGTQAVYNVGSPDRLSIAEIAFTIGEMLKVSVYIPSSPIGEPAQKTVLARFWNEFGVPDYTALHEGLQKTIDYQRGLYQ